MALSFIWKKQLVLFVTLILVIALGLTIGIFLHDVFQKTTVNTESENSEKVLRPGVKIVVPSLPYPTTKPGVNGPAAGVLPPAN